MAQNFGLCLAFFGPFIIIPQTVSKENDLMKRMFCLGVLVALSLVVAAVAFAVDPHKLTLKVGDEVYVCNCGESCDCLTMSRKEANCVCKKPMVKAKVTKVDKDLAMVQAPGWGKPRLFKTVGKYACACGPSCDCGTISQKPGDCACGKPMKEVK